MSAPGTAFWISVVAACAGGLVLNLLIDRDGDESIGLVVMLVLYSLAFYALLTYGVLAAATDLAPGKRAIWAWAGPVGLILLVALPGTIVEWGKTGMRWDVAIGFFASMPGQVMATPIFQARKRAEEERILAATPDPCAHDVFALAGAPHVSLEVEAVAGQGDGLVILVAVHGPRPATKLVRLLADGRLDPGFAPNQRCLDYRHHRESMLVSPAQEIHLFTHVFPESRGMVRLAPDGHFLAASDAAEAHPPSFPSPAEFYRDWQGHLFAVVGARIHQIDEWRPSPAPPLVADVSATLPVPGYLHLAVFRHQGGVGVLAAKAHEHGGYRDHFVATERTGFRPNPVSADADRVAGILDDGSLLLANDDQRDLKLWLVEDAGAPGPRAEAFARAVEIQRGRMEVTAVTVLSGNRVVLAGRGKGEGAGLLTAVIDVSARAQ